jgi:hypothetical protein
MRQTLAICVGLLVAAAIPAEATASERAHQTGSTASWYSPPNGVVPDPQSAIDIARIAWSPINPRAASVKKHIWDKYMTASLDQDVWTVTQKEVLDQIGGRLIIQISRCNGRVMDVRITQE